MFLVVFFNLWNLLANYKNMNLPSILSFIFGSLIFQMLIAIMLLVFYKNTPEAIIESKELERMLEEYEIKNNL